MAQNKSNGCLIAVIVTPIILIAVAIFFVFLRFATVRSEATHHGSHSTKAVENRPNTLILQENQLATIPPHQSGDTLTREQFVAHLIDDKATDLMKSNFRRSAEGAVIRWSLQTQNISDSGDELSGSFTLPYEVRRVDGSRASNVAIQCMFDPSSLSSLIRLRQGDWATITGRLTLEGSTPLIQEAFVIDDTPRPEAD